MARLGLLTATLRDRQRAWALVGSPDGTRHVGMILTLTDAAKEDIAPILDRILGSFRFTIDRIESQEQVRRLIAEAGIRPAPESSAP